MFKKLFKIFGVLIALTMLGIAVLIYLWYTPPAYWKPVAVTEEVKQRAAQIEQEFSGQITAPRPYDQEWKLSVKPSQVNEWIAVRMPQWLANQNVDAHAAEFFNGAIVHVENGNIELANKVDLGGTQQVIRLIYKPEKVAGEPTARLNLIGVMGGRVPIPLETVIDQVSKRIPQNNPQARARFEQSLAKLRSMPLDLPLGDGRDVRVTDLDLSGDAAQLKLQTHFTPRGR